MLRFLRCVWLGTADIKSPCGALILSSPNQTQLSPINYFTRLITSINLLNFTKILHRQYVTPTPQSQHTAWRKKKEKQWKKIGESSSGQQKCFDSGLNAVNKIVPNRYWVRCKIICNGELRGSAVRRCIRIPTSDQGTTWIKIYDWLKVTHNASSCSRLHER